MPHKKIALLIVAALLIGFPPGSAMMAATSAPDEADLEPAGNEITAGASSSATAPLTLPASALLDFGMRLIGTAVVDGGSSVAVIQFSNGTRFVREGEEILTGMRLVKIRRDRVDVERAGVIQDMRARSGSDLVIAGNAAPVSLPANVDPAQLWQSHGRLGRSMFYSHYRNSQN